MNKHIWKVHENKTKNKDFDNALIDIFNIGDSYFKGYISTKEAARAISEEINNATKQI